MKRRLPRQPGVTGRPRSTIALTRGTSPRPVTWAKAVRPVRPPSVASGDIDYLMI